MILPKAGGGMRRLQPRMRVTSRVVFLLIGSVLFLIADLQPAKATDNAVLQWNEGMLDAIRNTKTAPPIAARAIAITHTAMFDAWAAYDSVAKGTPTRRYLAPS